MSNDVFRYALFTQQTGCRPMHAFVEIFEHLIDSLLPRLEEIEADAGSTRRRGLEIALSDTAILMTYSLVEGFFFEEYKFYFGKEPKRGGKLEEIIQKLVSRIDVSNGRAFRQGISLMPGLRAARNAIAHRNGGLNDVEKKLIQTHLGEDVNTSRGYPIASTSFIIDLLRRSEQLISEYSKLALESAAKAPPTASIRELAS